MLIRVEKVKEDEFELIFPMVKNALFPYVDAVYGWNDEFQQARLRNDYEPAWYHWLYDGDDRVGMVCFKYLGSFLEPSSDSALERSLHLHLVIILPEYQGRGLGAEVMNHLGQLARQNTCNKITLSCFIENQRAVKFYQTLGYQIILEEEHFFSFELDVNASA
ncbi:Histone acetyltransferase [Marinomonas sp. MED121]|uniref:GNAT family N-acetyltransferase n=1 Tax=Marinomonas sp. MED121 TaxID=314277 RepID=UPI0000691082|nr:GNAT family N-acetyltransferase [Marinomonas sp. MED121]EAQ67456.1 Histone acetyltransferase [Marinomonas sp. MED121]